MDFTGRKRQGNAVERNGRQKALAQIFGRE
jgi:hypothetical protein